jgi:hypothetical protein
VKVKKMMATKRLDRAWRNWWLITMIVLAAATPFAFQHSHRQAVIGGIALTIALAIYFRKQG